MELKNIKYNFDNNHDFSLSIPYLNIGRGDILFLHGTSGCGKTTILNLLSGVLKSDISSFVSEYYSSIDYLMHDLALVPWLSVQNIFLTECKLRKKNADFELFKSYLIEFKLTNVLNKTPKELSLGMKQRIAIAKSLTFYPELLLLDESFSGVDSSTKQIVFKSIIDFVTKKNVTIIATTHQIIDQLSIANKIAFIDKGEIFEIFEIDTPAYIRLGMKKEELLKSEYVQKFFG